MQNCKSLVGQYRLNALTLNRDLVARVDEEIAFELDMTPDEVLSQHWIFQDRMYSAALADLVRQHGIAGVAVELRAQARELGLDEASIVPSRQVSPDLVTMYSQVLVLDAATGQRIRSLPRDAAYAYAVLTFALGEAMALLIDAVRDDRPGEGLALAIGRVGAILAPHFPRAADDINELPDRLIEL